MEVDGPQGSLFMVELHYVQCIRMKPEEAGGRRRRRTGGFLGYYPNLNKAE